MSVIEQITAHYSNTEIASVDVPEWGAGGEPLTIYWTPLTIREHGSITKRSKGDISHFNIEVLLAKALDAEGNKLFTLEDKQKLLRAADARIIARVAEAILSDVDDPDTHLEN